MKFPILLIIISFLIQISFAQTNEYAIICPENTFLGVYDCSNIGDVPPLPDNIEEAMAPPYNIEIDGELPEFTNVTARDDNTIFICEEDQRVVTREIIFYTGVFGYGGFEPFDVIARCFFTIETVPDTIPIDFIPPADYVIDCDNIEITDGEVTFLNDACAEIDQSNAFFRERTQIVGDTILFIRNWQTQDMCRNYSTRKEQVIKYSCPSVIPDVSVICPENTFLGNYDCTNIVDVPDQPGNIDEVMAAPYNLQIEGDLTSDIRVDTEDDGTIFYCESDPRTINRSIIIYKDLNYNFIWDIGEEIGGCSYTLETIPDITPLEIIAPPDIDLVCGLDPFDISNTGDLRYEDDTDCNFNFSQDPTIYDDEVVVDGNITTIFRTWSASDPCGNISEPQVQTITVNCEPENEYTITCPENTFLGAYDCYNINDIPDLPYNIDEAMAAPYNLQIEGDLTDDIRIDADDDESFFHCEDGSIIVNRSIILYIDINFNFVYDAGEEIGACNYTLEAIPNPFPDFTVPLDIEIGCGVEPNPENTGDVMDIQTRCPVNDGYYITFSDSTIINSDFTIINRTWQANILCDYIEKQQTITINCEPVCIPPNVGIFECGN